MVPDAAFPDRHQALQTAPFPGDFRSIETEIGRFAMGTGFHHEKISRDARKSRVALKKRECAIKRS
jgi:hypothetical protein